MSDADKQVMVACAVLIVVLLFCIAILLGDMRHALNVLAGLK